MKKILALILARLMIVGMFAGCKKEEKGMTKEAGKLIMSTNAAFPPYEMTDDNGKFIGIDVEIAEAIADKLGLELVVQDMGFTAALEAGKLKEQNALTQSYLRKIAAKNRK